MAKGQQKTHTATRFNPETQQTETRTFTQEEWRARNKAEGWARVDAETGVVEDETGVVTDEPAADEVEIPADEGETD